MTEIDDRNTNEENTGGPDQPPAGPHQSPEPRVSPLNAPVVAEFRANGGRVGGPFAGGDLLLLTTTGARSGQRYTTPLGFVRIEDRVHVVGSAGGSPKDPDWYRNLLAHPIVTVEMPGDEARESIAVPLAGDERDRIFREIVSRHPGYGDYQDQVERRIPVVELQPSPELGSGEVRDLADKLLQIHAWLRGQLTNVRAEAERYLAERDTASTAPPVGLNLQIRQHCLAFCESLHFHHTSEDSMFPALAEGYPHLREPVERLVEEHRVVDRVRAELEGLLADVRTADPVRFMAELDRLTEELEAHLDFEEEALIPTLSGIPFPPA